MYANKTKQTKMSLFIFRKSNSNSEINKSAKAFKNC